MRLDGADAGGGEQHPQPRRGAQPRPAERAELHVQEGGGERNGACRPKQRLGSKPEKRRTDAQRLVVERSGKVTGEVIVGVDLRAVVEGPTGRRDREQNEQRVERRGAQSAPRRQAAQNASRGSDQRGRNAKERVKSELRERIAPTR